MEVFIHGVPERMNDRALEEGLVPYLKALGIHDWIVEKPRRRRFAFIKFLTPKQGQDFIQKHGPHRTSAPISIMGATLSLKKSNKTIDSHVLGILQYQRDERLKSETAIADSGIKPRRSIVFSMHSFACGHHMFVKIAGHPQDQLTFIQQCGIAQPGTIKFGKRMLYIKMEPDGQAHVPFNTIQELVVSPQDASLTIVLTEPPRFYSKAEDLAITFTFLGLDPEAHNPREWIRTTHLDGFSHEKYVGSCLVYRLRVLDQERNFLRSVAELRSWDVFPVMEHHIMDRTAPHPSRHDIFEGRAAFYEQLCKFARLDALPFEALFQIQAFVWNGRLHPTIASELLILLVRWVGSVSSRPIPFTYEVLQKFAEKLPTAAVGEEPEKLRSSALVSSIQDLQAQMQREDAVRGDFLRSRQETGLFLVHRAVVTPTRVLLQGPHLEPGNRVLRKFRHHTNYFLRVQFSDEDGNDLMHSSTASQEKFLKRFSQVMDSGLQVCGRLYGFLGFSHSSLRSHSAWFSASFVDSDLTLQSYAQIIQDLGDFDEIRVPARCAARIGQAFSETPVFLDLEEHGVEVKSIADVSRGDRVFSDGVGTLSEEVMRLIWARLGFKRASPTCFQIRWGGAKGMLALDSTLEGRLICIRPSMEKFPSRDQSLMGICDQSSKPLHLYLNRQLVKILEDMGVELDWFLRLQDKEILRLRAVTETPYSAQEFLGLQGIGASLYLSSLIHQLDIMGIDYRRDRFLRSIMETAVLKELRLVKYKARIPVPEGSTLFGVMDETGFLKQGEVCVMLQQEGQGRGKSALGEGHVLVTRSPALHPGDIQIATNKIPPAGHPLEDLDNCIIFSQFGARDLPSQLSGGDLDGDQFHVFWDPAVVKGDIITFQPADYPRAKPEPLDHRVTKKDMSDFFINFMEADQLGFIATRHMVLADFHKNGTLHSECLALAEMHSTAVDFSKTGIPVKSQKMPRAKYRPDFMTTAPPATLHSRGEVEFLGVPESIDDEDEEVGSAPKIIYYKSEKLLGTLYRRVNEKRVWDRDIRRLVAAERPDIWSEFRDLITARIRELDPTLSFNHNITKAWQLRHVYEDAVASAMKQYSDSPSADLSELEVVTGIIHSRTGVLRRRRRDAAARLRDEFEHIAQFVVAQMRRRGGAVLAGPDERDRDALELCWACFSVAMPTGESGASGGGAYPRTARLESFRVVAASCLLKEVNAYARILEKEEGVLEDTSA